MNNGLLYGNLSSKIFLALIWGWEQTKTYISLLESGTASLGDLWKYVLGFGIITLMQGGF